MVIKLVIFDMDGVMFDTERVYFSAWKAICKKYGYIITEEHFKKLIGINGSKIKETLIKFYGEKFEYDKISNEKNNLVDKLINDNGVVIKEGLIELIAFLNKNNIKIAIATSSSKERVNKLLDLVGLKEKFKYIICGDEVSKSKPDPEIFINVANKLNIHPKECIVLEDSINGIYAAKNANMNVIMIPDMVEPDEEVLKLIYKKLDTLKEVIKIIEDCVIK